MKALLFHCQDFKATVTGLSTRPTSIVHEDVLDIDQSAHDCIVTFVTLENGDTEEKVPQLVKEILSFCEDTKHTNVFLSPFAHLSNNLAPAKEALAVLATITAQLKNKSITLIKGHFGSDKELMMHVYGHPGNVRYREF